MGSFFSTPSYKWLPCKKNEVRGLLKNCFKDKIFSFVPFEIWIDVLCKANRSLVVISQTCWGFREASEIVRNMMLELAFLYRKENQIFTSSIWLQGAAECGSALAMLHLGGSYYFDNSWGWNSEDWRALLWLKRSAERGNGTAMAFYALLLKHGSTSYGREIASDPNLSYAWACKALGSGSLFAIGYCYYNGLGTSRNETLAKDYFEKSALEGDEFGQLVLAETNGSREKALYWYSKCGEQGNRVACMRLEEMYRNDKNDELAQLWGAKASIRWEDMMMLSD